MFKSSIFFYIYIFNMLILYLLFLCKLIDASSQLTRINYQDGYFTTHANGAIQIYPTTPYMNLSVTNNKLINIYDWNVNYTANPFFTQTKYFNIRIDGILTLPISISLNCDDTSTIYRLYLQMSFLVNKIFISFPISPNGNCNFVGTNNITIQNNIYYILQNTNLINYCLQLSANSTFDLDLNQFIKSALQMNFLNLTDYLVKLTIGTQIFSGQGTLLYYHQFLLNKYKITTPSSFVFLNRNFANVQYQINSSSLEYLNISYPSNSQNLSDLTIQYYYNRITLNAYPVVNYGYKNNKWITSIFKYNLPSTNAFFQIMIAQLTFQYNNYYNNNIDRISACWNISMRNDYNPSYMNFTTNSSTPTRQIVICPFWGNNLTKPGQSLQICELNQNIYDYYLSNQQNSWPTYYFILKQNTFSINIDLNSFVKFIYAYNNLSTEYIVSIQQGFLIYEGYGNFIIYQQSINVTNISDLSLQEQITVLGTINSGNNSFSEKQIYQTYPIFYQVVLAIVSTPNLAIICQALTPFLKFINQFSYYSYHKRNYDKNLISFAYLMLNLTNAKWTPIWFEEIVSKLYYSTYILSKDYNKIPNKFKSNGEDIYLIKNLQNYFVSSIPLSILTFIILRIIYVYSSVSEFSKFSKLLKGFSNWNFILISLIQQNIQYISFQCFTQFYFIIPLGIIGYANIIICYILLFILLVYSISMYFMLKYYYRKRMLIFLENLKPHLGSIFLTSITLILEFFNGFVHAYLYQHQIIQIALVLSSKILCFLAIIKYRQAFKYKILFFTYIIEYLLKISLNLFFLVEMMIIKQSVFNNNMQNQLGNVEIVILIFIIIINSNQFFIMIVITIKQFSIIAKQKKIKKKIIKMKNLKVNDPEIQIFNKTPNLLLQLNNHHKKAKKKIFNSAYKKKINWNYTQ